MPRYVKYIKYCFFISDMDIPAANVKQFSGSGIGGEF